MCILKNNYQFSQTQHFFTLKFSINLLVCYFSHTLTKLSIEKFLIPRGTYFFKDNQAYIQAHTSWYRIVAHENLFFLWEVFQDFINGTVCGKQNKKLALVLHSSWKIPFITNESLGQGRIIDLPTTGTPILLGLQQLSQQIQVESIRYGLVH